MLFGQEGAPAGTEQPGGVLGMLVPFVIMGLLFYVLLLRPEKRKQAEHKNTLDSMKKNDRVVTIGGIYGTVANVNRDADRVTLKVDDNTKIDVTIGAIARVLSESPAAEKTSS